MQPPVGRSLRPVAFHVAELMWGGGIGRRRIMNASGAANFQLSYLVSADADRPLIPVTIVGVVVVNA